MDIVGFFLLYLFGIVILFGLVIYIGLILRVFFIHPYLVYNPNRYIEHTPGYAGLDYQEIFFNSEDGVKLSAWYVPAEESEHVVLFCHGNAGNISDRLDLIKTYYHIGFSVFIFDYRGYGQSRGKPSEKGTYKDAEAAWNYLVNEKKIEPGNIIIASRSLGGAVASYLAGKTSPKALIIEGSFTSMPDMGKLFYPYLPMRWIVRYRYNNLQHLKKVHCPVLIIHSLDDRLVPFQMGQALYEAANPPKQFLQIRGSHNDAFQFSRNQYMNGIKEFISGL